LNLSDVVVSVGLVGGFVVFVVPSFRKKGAGVAAAESFGSQVVIDKPTPSFGFFVFVLEA